MAGMAELHEWHERADRYRERFPDEPICPDEAIEAYLTENAMTRERALAYPDIGCACIGSPRELSALGVAPCFCDLTNMCINRALQE